MNCIKFRVFHTILNRYYYGDSGVFLLDLNGKLHLSHEGGKCVNEDRLILEQFSGKKDKEGKDIFLGDILESMDGNRKSLFIVQWSEESACFGATSINTGNEQSYYCILLSSFDWKVVGNVNENKELMKGL